MKKHFILLLAVAAVLSATLSCGQRQQRAKEESKADSLLGALISAADYQRAIVLADSLEQAGDISPFTSAFYQGLSYEFLNDIRHAEEVLKSVMNMTPTTSQDSAKYIQCLCRIAEVHSMQEDYEGVLRIALPLVEKMNESEGKKDRNYGILTEYVGSAQWSLGLKEDAAQSFDMSYNFWQELSVSDPAWQNIANLYLSSCDAYYKYMSIGDLEGAMKWYHRQDSALAILSERDDMPSSEFDRLVASNCLVHAELAIAQKNKAEINRAIANYKKTARSKTLGGQINAADVLLHAERYAEAADAYALLDQYAVEANLDTTLFNLSRYMGSKFMANYKAGRRDSAMVVAAFVFENLDSAIAKQKNSTAAELATVYHTQQKDAEIAQQQIELSRQRLWGAIIGFGLITLFFIIYTLHRRRAAKRLAEMKATQERIESELRIARDIQMSMVPGVFPEHEGLDMYAEMTPAKEVGGDLYGYVFQGNMLYFCVGDVSGKGVPASLFMAQSARLFRTLAAEGLMPADIATRMNSELVEGNDSNMFVTMFIGLLHLDTGRLDFCNCGHNAPVLDDQFMEMQYVNQMIGVLEGAPFYGESIEDIRTHRLLIYTDGLNEAENDQQELLGNDRLLELMADNATLNSRQLINMLKEAVKQHRGEAQPNDDLTLMCLKLQ